MTAETIETIRDRIECRRVAEGFIQRMVASMKEERPVVEARHANAGNDPIVAMGPCMNLPSTDAVVRRHGRVNADEDTFVAFGPSLEIPLNPR